MKKIAYVREYLFISKCEVGNANNGRNELQNSERVMDISPTSLLSSHNTNDWRVTERTYNKLWQACSVRLVPSRPRSSPRTSSCHGRYGRQIPAAACWDRCRRIPSTIPRLSLSWQCCSLPGSPEVLSIDHRPNTNGRLSASADYRHRPHTLTKRSDDPPRSQVFPDPLSPPPPACLRTVYMRMCVTKIEIHMREYKTE